MKPIYSKPAEQSLLASVLVDPSVWSQISSLTAEYFYEERHRNLFKAYGELAAQQQPINVITVAEYLQKHQQLRAVGGEAYLGMLINSLSTASYAAGYAEIVREYAQRGGNENPEVFKGVYSLVNLDAATFEEVKYCVPGIIPEGVVLLTGAAKSKKSFLCLNLAIAMASTQGQFLGKNVAPGEVLYLALEDSPRRIKSRCAPMLSRQLSLPGLRFAHNWRPLGGGGELDIEVHLRQFPETKLVVIDSLARVRTGNLSRADYKLFDRLGDIAQAHPGLTILVVHHGRKLRNVFAGVVDAILVLKKNGELSVSGRDIKELALTLRFNEQILTWQLYSFSQGELDNAAAEPLRQSRLTSDENVRLRQAFIAYGTKLQRAFARGESGQDRIDANQLEQELSEKFSQFEISSAREELQRSKRLKLHNNFWSLQ